MVVKIIFIYISIGVAGVIYDYIRFSSTATTLTGTRRNIDIDAPEYLKRPTVIKVTGAVLGWVLPIVIKSRFSRKRDK